MPIKPTRDVFQAISDHTRRHIIKLLSKGPTRPRDLTMQLGMTNAAVAQHMKYLIECDVIKVRKKPAKSFYTLKNPKIAAAIRKLEKY